MKVTLCLSVRHLVFKKSLKVEGRSMKIKELLCLGGVVMCAPLFASDEEQEKRYLFKLRHRPLFIHV